MNITEFVENKKTDRDDGLELAALLEGQRGLVDRLADLAERQGEFIAAGRTDDLLGLLQQRQNLVDQFTKNQRRLGPLAERFRAGVSGMDGSRRERIRELLEEISGRIHEVLDRDRQDQESMKGVRDSIKEELSQLGSGRQARNAYLKPQISTNRFADRRG